MMLSTRMPRRQGDRAGTQRITGCGRGCLIAQCRVSNDCHFARQESRDSGRPPQALAREGREGMRLSMTDAAAIEGFLRSRRGHVSFVSTTAHVNSHPVRFTRDAARYVR